MHRAGHSRSLIVTSLFSNKFSLILDRLSKSNQIQNDRTNSHLTEFSNLYAKKWGLWLKIYVCCSICDDVSQLKFFDITVLSLVNCIFDELNAFSSRVLMSCYSACSKETSVEQGRVPFQLCNHSKMTYNDLDTIILLLTRASSQCHL